MNAPHIPCSVVVPGHIGTSIVANSRRIHGGSEPQARTAAEIAQTHSRIAATAADPAAPSDDDIHTMVAERARLPGGRTDLGRCDITLGAV